jgi:hypothetical protein
MKETKVRKCKHIKTGHIGIIQNELRGNDEFPDQYGIFWLQGQKNPPYYWNDKNLIEHLKA